MTNKKISKQWLDVTIQNNFIFVKTLETNPDLCRRLIELKHSSFIDAFISKILCRKYTKAHD